MIKTPVRLRKPLLLSIASCLFCLSAHAQFPYADTLKIANTKAYRDIPYVANGLKQQNLDLLLPDSAKTPMPLIIWIHGGGWDGGFKGWTEVSYLAKQGYAIATVEYRFSSIAPFPAQIKDCNAAIYFLWKNAKKYGLDTSRFVVAGGSAGGHLAALAGASLDNHVAAFYNDERKESKVHLKAVLAFYGISDLNIVHGKAAALDYDSEHSFLNKFLGVNALERPDVAAFASPVTYIDKNDPPVLILHGDVDGFVPFYEAQIYNSRLKLAGVKSELIKIPGANHAGAPFTTPDIQQKVIAFLNEVLKK